MSKRVYEIARELSLDTKEVMGRLNDAGVEVKNHFAAVEDPVYERVFGDLSGNGGARTAGGKGRGSREERSRGKGSSKGGKKRRRVVIDASATSRGSSKAHEEAPAGREEAQPSGGKKGGGGSDAVRVEPGATVNDLAEAIGVPGAQIVKVLFELGEMKTVTQTLSTEEIELVAEALGVKVEIGGAEEPAPEEGGAEDSPEDLVEKPPVVTVMGHVDHGKTSLLDYIRNTSVASGEAGGITQHIGAYQVEVDGRRITFIDTPGHEAFTEMRARGAQVTDIVVLVVAADDGVMPQTEEAIEHARAAGVPIVVALNKIDLPDANPDRVYGELAERGLTPEAWGGETVTVPVSAKTGEGVDELLENILVVAELEELRANPKAPASGYVIESELETGRGPVATLLITRGTLHKGDVVLAGTAYGRVRAMLDYTGKRIKEATPGTPVEILGLSGVPEAGTRFEVVEHERIARSRAEQQEAALRRQELAESGPRRTLEDLLGEGGTQELNLVVKADAAGSVEALKDALAKLSTDEVRINIVRSGVGALTDSDVMLASASDGILLGFNVRPTNTAKQLAEREGVEIRTYNVIYKAIEEIEAAMRGMLAPEETERETGTAEVRQTFRVPNVGTVAGCYVSSGEISRNDRVRVVREGVVIYDGQVASLRRFKDDVRSVRQGFECGVGIENFNDVKEGDVLEFYQVVEVPR
ncbi:MAG: translation initiation factor IF-2 [Rubrobacteraceae bacterium]|uniref:translation initiation factor IF-2 n=1 Tax=Rubrobacter naiadicus TaxID=1392641 RepID=UPI00235DE8D7|nr:translation initiation factor IF-2 [Rubrobacter naiadicus]MBX6762435.1 translation initiation factor IF-2 [Rubrobacteraceae bacterium]